MKLWIGVPLRHRHRRRGCALAVAAVLVGLGAPAGVASPSSDTPCQRPAGDGAVPMCQRVLEDGNWRVPGRVFGVAYNFQADGHKFLDGREVRRHGCTVSFANWHGNRVRVQFCDSPENRWWKMTLRAKTVSPTTFSWLLLSFSE